jgi:hypothetical protein
VICNLAKQCQSLLLAFLFLLPCAIVDAKRPEYELTLKSHLFYPAQIIIPSNKKVKLVIFNQDSSVEEFDSFDLNREKVIFPQQKAIIFIGPLASGEYEFFGEYHPDSARGTVIVVEHNEFTKQGDMHVD